MNSNLILSANGSIIKNDFYRRLLNESLQFEFKSIKWIIYDLSPAYGAGLISAQYNQIDVSIKDITKNI